MSNDLSPAYAHVSQDTKRSRLLSESISSRKQPAETQEYLKEMIMTEISRQSSDAHHWSAMPVPALIVGSRCMVGAFLKQDGDLLIPMSKDSGSMTCVGINSPAARQPVFFFPSPGGPRSGLVSRPSKYPFLTITIRFSLLCISSSSPCPFLPELHFNRYKIPENPAGGAKKNLSGNFLFVLFFFCGSFWNNVKCISWHAPQN